VNEQEEFFSPNQNRLLSLATWAHYVAWLVLVVYLLNAFLQPFRYQSFQDNAPPQWNLWRFLINDPMEAFDLVVNMATAMLKGVVSYLVLKGISLGLNMIVETDINYREQEQEEGAL
jgi:hypothetical protein